MIKIDQGTLIRDISGRSGLTQKDTKAALAALSESVTAFLAAGDSVALGSLGTLSVKPTAARVGVRPGTSEKMQIPAGKKVSLKVSGALKAAVQ